MLAAGLSKLFVRPLIKHPILSALLLLCVILFVHGRVTHPPNRYYEVTLDMTVDGQRVIWSNVFECYYFDSLVKYWPLGMDPTGYRLKYLSMSKRLPSGAGLIAVPPIMCHIARRAGEYPPAMDDFQKFTSLDKPPTIYWLDNAENPDQIEGYFASTYFEHAEARIKLHSVSAKYKRRGKGFDPRKEVPWIRSREDRSESWSALAVDIIPSEEWKKYALIERDLAKLSETGGDLLDVSSVPLGRYSKQPWFSNIYRHVMQFAKFMYQAEIFENQISVNYRNGIPGQLHFTSSSKHPYTQYNQNPPVYFSQYLQGFPLYIDGEKMADSFTSQLRIYSPKTQLLYGTKGPIYLSPNSLLSPKY